MGRRAPRAGQPLWPRGGALAHRHDAVPARDHGRPGTAVAGAPGRLHEGLPAGRHRGRQQLARVRDAPRARPDPGPASDRGRGPAVQPAAPRSHDRHHAGAARPGPRGAGPRRRQQPPDQGIPWRGPVPDRLELRDRRQVDADPLALLRRDRRVPRRRRRAGRPDRAGGEAHHRAALLTPQGIPGLDAHDQGHLPDRT